VRGAAGRKPAAIDENLEQHRKNRGFRRFRGAAGCVRRFAHTNRNIALI
jgi:hypothetical protein